MAQQEPKQSPVDRAIDRAIGGTFQVITGSFLPDVHATIMQVAYGNGPGVPPPYLTRGTGEDLHEGAALLGLTLEEHIGNTIGFMREKADELGLRGTL